MIEPRSRQLDEDPDEYNSDLAEQAKKGVLGGAPIFNEDSEKINSLKELAQQLHIEPDSEQLPPNFDLLKNGQQFFHPMLPIYMIAESLNEVVANDFVEDSSFSTFLTKKLGFFSISFLLEATLDLIA